MKNGSTTQIRSCCGAGVKQEEEQLFLIRVTRFIAGLDLEHSDIQWTIDNKLISTVNRHVFHEEKLIDVNIFKIPVFFTGTYVSDAF